MSDLLHLTTLAPEIVKALDQPLGRAPRITDRGLRKIARVRDQGEQVRRFRGVVGDAVAAAN